MKKLILGGLLGGIAVFVWGMVSWMVLPWHHTTFEKFDNEAMVQAVLAVNAPKAGIYLLPGTHKDKTIPLAAEKALMKKAHEQMEKGPFAFVAMRPGGTGPMNILMIRGLIIQIIGAFLLTLLLLIAGIENYFQGVGFAVALALAAGVVTFLPDWNWWGFSPAYALVGMADLVIGWFLAGLVIAKIVSR